MQNDREQALKLRLSGKSYGEISAILTIPKSTLSSWLANLEISETLKQKIADQGKQKSIAALVKRNKQQTALALTRNRKISVEARQEISSHTNYELILLGTSLYWAEGYKRQKTRDGRKVSYHPVSLTNSDPNLIRVFLKFLREACDVKNERIRVGVRYFEHQNLIALLDYWINVTGLPAGNFVKSLLSKNPVSRNIRPYNQLPYGLVQVSVADTALFYRIMGWIEGLKAIR